jgi:hypothetical protein
MRQQRSQSNRRHSDFCHQKKENELTKREKKTQETNPHSGTHNGKKVRAKRAYWVVAVVGYSPKKECLSEGIHHDENFTSNKPIKKTIPDSFQK